jgi:transposase
LLFKGKPLIAHDEAFAIEESLPHGHVEAILMMIRHLDLDSLICSTSCRQRDLVIAMIVDRLIHAGSKLATTRQWHMTTLASKLGVDTADVDELYDALDWLLQRQADIENALAKRHLNEGALVLYDVSSSYYEGHTCPLARFGNGRDGKKGLPIIVYGVLTDRQGRPVAVDVYPGNTGDPTTVPDQIRKLRDRFKLERIVIAGDRGMLTQTQLEAMKDIPGLGWVSALRCESIRHLMQDDVLQMSLFDLHNIAEISSPDFPGERLIACYNPLLAADRARTRSELVAATEKILQAIQRDVHRRTKKPLTNGEIGVKVGKAINKYKVGKHFKVIIEHGTLCWERKQESIDREAALDGIYVIRTSENAADMSKEDVVRSYKRVSPFTNTLNPMKSRKKLMNY